MERTTAGGLQSLRDANRRLVIQALSGRGVASRAEIARITGLSRSTVSRLVNDLPKNGPLAEREVCASPPTCARSPGSAPPPFARWGTPPKKPALRGERKGPGPPRSPRVAPPPVL